MFRGKCIRTAPLFLGNRFIWARKSTMLMIVMGPKNTSRHKSQRIFAVVQRVKYALQQSTADLGWNMLMAGPVNLGKQFDPKHLLSIQCHIHLVRLQLISQCCLDLNSHSSIVNSLWAALWVYDSASHLIWGKSIDYQQFTLFILFLIASSKHSMIL